MLQHFDRFPFRQDRIGSVDEFGTFDREDYFRSLQPYYRTVSVLLMPGPNTFEPVERHNVPKEDRLTRSDSPPTPAA